jgi:cell division protein ZapE
MTDFIHHFQHYAEINALNNDEHQVDLVQALNVLHNDLIKLAYKFSWFKKEKLQKGLYIWGGVGRGKTMIMDLFYDFLGIEAKRRVHFNIFMIDVHSNISILRKEGRGADPLKTIAKEISQSVKLLCFDEFQVYDIADAMVLDGLFSELFDLGVVVIATSNVAPNNLYKDGLQRSRFLPFIDRVNTSMNVIRLDAGIDYRQQLLDEDGVYFVGEQSKFMDLFSKLTHYAQTETVSIDVKGRHIYPDKAYDGVGLFSFSDLCEKPRGVSDYSVLVEKFHTVFINHIPRMGYDRRNELKRFILLIDTFYDAGLRVVFLAEDIPNRLYDGKNHAFEFDRTISRITEMQGADYLSRTGFEK